MRRRGFLRSLERALSEQASPFFGDAIALTVLFDEPLVDKRADALVNPARRSTTEVCPWQPDRLGELVDTSIRHVAQRSQQILVDHLVVHSPKSANADLTRS